MPAQHVEEFDPNTGMEVISDDESLLDGHEFEIDAIEAQESTDEPGESLADAEDSEPGASDAGDEESEAEGDSDADTEESDAGDDAGDGELGESDTEEEALDSVDDTEITDADALANPNENPLIPRERLNAESRKRREQSDRADNALQRVAELEAQIKQVTLENNEDASIDTSAIKEAAEKVLDGDTDTLAALLTDMFAKNKGSDKESNEALLELATQNAVSQIRAEAANTERQTAAAEWLAKYPELDSTNADIVNDDALEEALMLRNMYEDKGFSPAVAMKRAVKAVAASHNLKSNEPDVTENEEVQTTVTKKKIKVPNKRKAPKIKQPAGVGAGGDNTEKPKIDADTISQDDWEALPESVREDILNN